MEKYLIVLAFVAASVLLGAFAIIAGVAWPIVLGVGLGVSVASQEQRSLEQINF